MTPLATTQTAAKPHALENPASRLIPQLGRFGPRWLLTAAALLVFVAIGAYAFIQQELHGEGITGMRTIGSGGATWGLYIVGVIFFIGVSFAGITIAAIIRLLNIETLRPLSRAAELLTIVALMMGATCVIADLGQPIKGLLNLPKFARPWSPFFGTFSLVVGGYLSASCVYFFLAGRADATTCARSGGRLKLLHWLWATGNRNTPAESNRHHRVSFWLSILILPLLVTAHSTLGFIFGIQGGRPGWYNGLAGPGFVVMAGVSGIGVLIVVAAALRKFMHLEDIIKVDAIRWLGNMLLALTAVYLYFMIAEEVTANYAAVAAESKIAHEVVFGAYAPLFWTVASCLLVSFVVLFIQFVRRKTVVWLTVTAGLLVNVAAVLKRFLLVVPSQTHGMLLPYETGVYSPTWVEYSVVGGLLALGTLLYMTFVKIFPIIPIETHHAEEAVPHHTGILRPALTIGTLVTGVAMAVTGFLLSARFGTERYQDPIMPYAPVLFISGVVTCLLSSVVYELLPEWPAAPEKKETPATTPVESRLAVQ